MDSSCPGELTVADKKVQSVARLPKLHLSFIVIA